MNISFDLFSHVCLFGFEAIEARIDKNKSSGSISEYIRM